MESNVNGGEGTLPNNSSSPSESIIEQLFNKDTDKYDHFSICAYVAEIRKKDWKICRPFCSSVECKEPNDHSVYKNKDCEENVDSLVKTNLNVGGAPNSGILEFEFGDGKLNCKRSCANETCFKGELIKVSVSDIAKTCEKGMDSITYPQLPESESKKSGSSDSQLSCHRNLVSLKSNRNDENRDTKSVHGEQQSNKFYRSILKSKRPQKVRLLSDILRGGTSGCSCDLSSSNGTVNSDYMDTRVKDTEAADDSDDLTLDTLFRSRKVIQPNTGKIIGCRNSKKRPQVEDTDHVQSRCSNAESDVSWSQNSNKDNNSLQSVMGSSASVKTDLSRDVSLVSRAEKRKRKSSFEGRRSSSKMSQENLCQELRTDPESKETQTGTGNHQVHLPNDAPKGSNPLKPEVGGSQHGDLKSCSCVKEGREKCSLMLPHEFVPMKKQDIEPYFPASNKRSDSPCHLKNKHGALKRKKGSSISCNYENNIVAQTNAEARESPSSEMNALDDISMEIVKLLAENRRERRLLEAETANRNTACLLKSVNRVENSHKFHPRRAYYDDVKSTDSRKNTFQNQRKPSGVRADTINETISLRKLLDIKIYCQKTTEKPCACEQKKIGMSPKLDESLNTNGNESMPRMQLVRLMEAGMSSRKLHNDGLHKICDAHKMPFPVEQHKDHTFGGPIMHTHSKARNIDFTRIGARGGHVSGDNVSGCVKSCKKAKLKSSLAPLETKNGRVNGDVYEKNTSGTGYRPFSFNKGQSSALDYNVLSVDPNMVKGTLIHGEVMKKKKGAVTRPVKGGEICCVNRNPADFSRPGRGNKFMRRGISENSRKGNKREPNIGKMAGSMKGFIPT